MFQTTPIWAYIAQILLIIHVLKTGRPKYWIFLLIFIPYLAPVAYIIVEILPPFLGSIHGQRTQKKMSQWLNPAGETRRRALAWERTPNADNARHYASALLERGQFDEAAEILETALSGLFRTEPNLMLLLARVRFESGEAAAAAELLDELHKANPDFRSAEGHLLLARALEHNGATEKALEAYRSVIGYYPGVEARYRYAKALEAAGSHDGSRQEMEAIARDADLAPAHFRKSQAHWLRKIRKALK